MLPSQIIEMRFAHNRHAQASRRNFAVIKDNRVLFFFVFCLIFNPNFRKRVFEMRLSLFSCCE